MDTQKSGTTSLGPDAAFENTVRELDLLAELVSQERIGERVKGVFEKIKPKDAPPGLWTPTPDELNQLTTLVVKETVNYAHSLYVIAELMAVRLVAGLDAYVLDRLTALALHNPALLEGTNNVTTKTLFAATSLEQLLDGVAQEWARAFVNAGVAKWMPRLRKLGARIPADVSAQVWHLYETRNLVVHAAGRIDREYFKKYRSHSKAIQIGRRVSVEVEQVQSWTQASVQLVRALKTLFDSYGRGQRQEDSVGQKGERA